MFLPYVLFSPFSQGGDAQEKEVRFARSFSERQILCLAGHGWMGKRGETVSYFMGRASGMPAVVGS